MDVMKRCKEIQDAPKTKAESERTEPTAEQLRHNRYWKRTAKMARQRGTTIKEYVLAASNRRSQR